MKKQFNRLASILLLVFLFAGVLSLPVSAAGRTGSKTSPVSEALTAEGYREGNDSSITPETESTITVNSASLTWKTVGRNLRLVDAKGKYKTGFVKFKNQLYYFNKKGNLVTRFFKVNGKTYYASILKGYKGKGQILTGLVHHGKYYYYFNPKSKPYKGVLSTGFQKISGRLYYFNKAGHMVTGWFKVNGNKYYASRNHKGHFGALLTGRQTFSGMTYNFDTKTGKLLSSKKVSTGYERVIDVSEHQGPINFNKVKASGVRTVIIRAGYGTSNVDKYFYSNIKKAKAAGMRIGIYWFSYAYNNSMAAQEAKFCLRVIRKYSINLPVYYDWEYDSMNKANRKGHYPGRNEITEMTRTFCNTITKGGRRAGWYFNLHYLNSYYTPSRLKGFSTWYAYWGSNSYSSNIWSRIKTMPIPRQYDMWQFSSRGSIPGISGNVDCDLLLNTALLK